MKDDSITYSMSYRIHTQVVKQQEEEKLKAIQEYCEKNNIIPNIIDADKLELILKLGIQEFVKREVKK